MILESDRGQVGSGDLVFRTGGVERARIAHDGTGSGWSNVLGGSSPIYAPKPTGVAATDTANLQAAIDDALTSGAKLITSSYTDVGTIEAYQIDDTLNIVPPANSPDGYAHLDWEHHGYPKNSSILWAGANSGTMIHVEGLKRSELRGVNLGVTDGTTGVICWDLDVTSANPSIGFNDFYGCHTNLGTGTSNVGWRLGHTNGGVADISFCNWFGGSVVGNNNTGTTVSGQYGWVNESSNGLNLCWYGSGAYCLDKGVTNVSTSGAGSSTGNDAMFFYGFGASHNATDFEFTAPGGYVISGGRFENGTTFLNAPSGSGHVSVTMHGCVIASYAVGAVFNFLKPGTLSLTGCYLYGTAYTSALFTLGGFTGTQGQLVIRGGGIRGSDPFYTVSAGTWNVTVDGVAILNSSNQSNGMFAGIYPHDLEDVYRSKLGYVSWGYDPLLATNQTAPTSQTIYAMPVALRAGQVVSKVGFVVQTAGVGTTPTNIYAGLCDSTGKMVAQSADLKADSGWTSAGIKSFSLSASYTVPTTGLYYVVFLQNGTWGTTAMQLSRTSGLGTQIDGAGSFLYATGGTGQTALPANGSSITLAGSSAPLNYARFVK